MGENIPHPPKIQQLSKRINAYLKNVTMNKTYYVMPTFIHEIRNLNMSQGNHSGCNMNFITFAVKA